MTPPLESENPESSAEDTAARSRRRRRRLALVAVAILVLLLLALTPPLINVSRLRNRIATSMSQSLGRPVHLDNVSLHLLPVPGFTLDNLVVSEDPAFGYEPVIRANSVEATLRVSSLWRRHVEFSTLRFIDPSLNIVRNAQGHWNLEEILMQAAHANTAPTAQRKPGPAPRFPYIEATGARINLKLGDQKMPFSLTAADFSLWLPSPQQWHIRLQGTPARTDTDASDTGVARMEGTLGRASQLVDVPLDLTASWAGAPLGEASRLFTGNDAGWRGTVNAGVHLAGTLGAAHLAGDVHLTDLRRADFIPAHPLDVSTHCSALADVATVTLATARCTVPNSGPLPLAFTSASLDLQRPLEANVGIELNAVPLSWMLNWVRLFSETIPAGLNPHGTVAGTLTRSAGTQPHPNPQWSGSLLATLPPPKVAPSSTLADGKKNAAPALAFDFHALPAPSALTSAAPAPTTPAAPSGLILTLQPVALRLGPASPLTLSGTIDFNGYNFHLAGEATASQLTQWGSILPPLGEDLNPSTKPVVSTKPTASHSAAKPAAPTNAIAPVNIECSREWNGPQVCVAEAVKLPTKQPHRRRRR